MPTDRTALDSIVTPDGSPACLGCPMEIRNLMATVHNALGAYERSEWGRLRDKMHSLRMAMELVQPITDAHFRDEMHAFGRTSTKAQWSAGHGRPTPPPPPPKDSNPPGAEIRDA